MVSQQSTQLTRLSLPQRVGKGHDGVADELQLVLKVRIVLGELLLRGARVRVGLVVGRQRAVGVAALEVVLPEFCKEEESENELRIECHKARHKNNRGGGGGDKER